MITITKPYKTDIPHAFRVKDVSHELFKALDRIENNWLKFQQFSNKYSLEERMLFTSREKHIMEGVIKDFCFSEGVYEHDDISVLWGLYGHLLELNDFFLKAPVDYVLFAQDETQVYQNPLYYILTQVYQNQDNYDFRLYSDKEISEMLLNAELIIFKE
jgi:hypothetical protein